MKFETLKFSDVTINYDKKRIPLSAMERIKRQGKYRYYGAQGIIDYIDDYIFDGKYLLIAEDGENLKSKKQNIAQIAEGKFWVNNHAHIVQCNDKCRLEYLCFLLNSMELSGYITGSAQPKLSQVNMNSISLILPSVETQDLILSVILPIEQKIALNTAINENLQEQAQAIFKSWFLDYDPWDGCIPDHWIKGKLGDFTVIKRGGSPRPIQEYLSDSGLRWLKISDVTSLQSPFVIDIKEHIIEAGLKKTVFLKAGSLVLSNSATPGIPKILDVDSCIHDGWLYFPESKLSKEYLYLYFIYIRQQLINLSNGSVFNNLKTDILKAYPTMLPDKKTLQCFDEIVKPMFLQIQNNSRESHRLAKMRDALLPKLMNGEIDVSKLDL